LDSAAADPEDDGPGGGPDGGGPDDGEPDDGEPAGGGTGEAADRQPDQRGEGDGQVPPQQTPQQQPQFQPRQSQPQPQLKDEPRPQPNRPAQPAADQAAVAAQDPYRTRLFSVPGVGEGVPGRRSAGRSAGRGRTVGAERPAPGAASGQVIHLPATLRAAAPHQVARRASGSGAEVLTPVRLRPDDLRTAVRRDREGNLVLFAVDASGSMAARARMSAVKGAVLSLLLDAYQRRDKVGLVTFRGSEAEVALPPTGSVEAAAARLGALATGGRTPLAAGLLTAYDVVRRARLRDPRRRPLLVLVTDGRATGGTQALAEARRAAAFLAEQRVASIVVDCESGPVRLGLAAELAVLLEGEHVPMAALSADALDRAVRSRTRPEQHSDHLARKAA
jgi:magnesium chelatase subunit D